MSGSHEKSRLQDPPLRPLPLADALTEGFWLAVRANRLSIQRCAGCRHWNHAPGLNCRACGSEDLAFEPVSGRGKIYSWTVLHNSPGPGFQDLLPLIVGIVELEEQERLLMTTNLLDVRADRLSLGMPVEVVYEAGCGGLCLAAIPTGELSMWEFRDKVAVAGVGYSKLSRRTTRSLASLTLNACDAALAEAGLERGALDGIATSPSMPRYGGQKGSVEGVDVVTPWRLSELLGIVEQIEWTGSTNGMVTQSFIEAAMAIASGVCKHVIVYRALHVPQGSYVNFDSRYAVGPEQFQAPFGFSMPPAWAATVMRRYFELFGYSRADLARFIVENRANTQLNPNGYWRGQPITDTDYLDARMIAEPMCILDCDIPIDGACAILLTSTERARDLRQPPALLTGFAASTYPNPSGLPMTLEDLWLGSEQTARRLWASSGLGPQDIDTAQLYDGFSFFVVTWLEGLGIVERGQGLAFLRDGHGALNGKLPINTGGGALGEGRLHGMTHLAEAVVQVTGRGGARQAPGANRAVATISNGLERATAFIFSRDA